MRVPGAVIRTGGAVLLVPAAATTASGAGLSGIGITVVACAALASAIWWARRSPEESLTLSRGALAGWLVLASLALLQDVRVSWYMADGTRLLGSALPNPFVTVHQCLSGYTEATRRALEGRENIYDDRLNNMPDGGPKFMVRRDGITGIYDQQQLRKMFDGGGLPRAAIVHLDQYEYPPPFLLLPYVVGAPLARDYFRIRAVWFGLQAAVLWMAFVLSLDALRPDAWTRAFAWLPAVWLAPPTLVGLQYGNFQTGVVALSVMAMIAFTRRREAPGGALLAFSTLSKVFPGLLLVALAISRRWRALAWTVAWALLFTILAWAVFGQKPFGDFVFYQIPAIASGAAFTFNNRPEWIPTNYGVYAVVAKMRQLGLPGMTQATGTAAASVYGLLLVGFVAVVLGRVRADTRGTSPAGLGSALVWLPILNLASVRSPYVGDGYAQVGTLWLLALVAASQPRTRGQFLGFSLMYVAWSVTLEGFVPAQPPAWMVVFSLLTQVGLIVFNLAVLMRAIALSLQTTIPVSSSGVTPGAAGGLTA